MGGTSTAVLDTFYGFYTPGGRAHKIAGGISDEVVAGLRELGPVVERPNTYGAGTGVTYNAEHLKLVWERLATEAGVRVLLHTFLQGATVRDGHVEELIVATKAGLARVRGRVYVDASGDADLCHHAGFGYELAGVESPAQTLTTTFKMVNVDIARRKRLSTAEVHQRMAEAAESGDYDLPRREGSDHITPIEGMIATVMTRLDSFRTVGRPGHQCHRPGTAGRGRDATAGARPSSTRASCATACPATRTPRWSRSRRRSASARRGASTATTA